MCIAFSLELLLLVNYSTNKHTQMHDWQWFGYFTLKIAIRK